MHAKELARMKTPDHRRLDSEMSKHSLNLKKILSLFIYFLNFLGDFFNAGPLLPASN
jgi:hypothetical protein